MHEKLNLAQGELAGQTGTAPHQPRHDGHQQGQRHGGDEALQESQDGVGQKLNPAQENEGLAEEPDVAQRTDEGGRHRPEDDGGEDEGAHGKLANHALEPAHAQRRPDDLVGRDANEARRHVQGPVVGEGLQGALGGGLGGELDEDGPQRLSVLGVDVFGAERATELVDARVQGLEALAGPLDGVDAAEEVAEGPVGGAVRGGKPLCSDGTVDIREARVLLRVVHIGVVVARGRSGRGQCGAAVMEGRRLGGGIMARVGGREEMFGETGSGALAAAAGTVGEFDEADLGLLETEGGFIPLVDEPSEFARVARNPDVDDIGFAKDLAKAAGVEIAVGDALEEDGARGEAVCVVGMEEVCMSEVDVEDGLAIDGEQNEACCLSGTNAKRQKGET